MNQMHVYIILTSHINKYHEPHKDVILLQQTQWCTGGKGRRCDIGSRGTQ